MKKLAMGRRWDIEDEEESRETPVFCDKCGVSLTQDEIEENGDLCHICDS